MVLDQAAFVLSPPPPQNGIEFCAGGGDFFRGAGGTVTFGTPIPPPELFPGVFLDALGFDVALDPVLVRGNATISAAELTALTGTVLVGFPSPSSPYTLTTADASSPTNNGGIVGDLAPLAGRTLFSPFVALGGTASLRIPGLDRGIDFGHALLPVLVPRLHRARRRCAGGPAGVHRQRRPRRRAVVQDQAVQLARQHPGVHRGPALRRGWKHGHPINGIVACLGDIRHGGLHPGAGYHWGDFWPTIWLIDGCKPSNYWITSVTGAADAAAAARTFTVARGESAKNVRLRGVGGAPNVEVRGPDGETVSTATSTYVTSRTLAILRQDAGKVTWIGVNHGKPGRYTITLLPGSPQIAELAGTRPGSREITATVTGSASRRTLHYVIGSPTGERVTFFERAGATFTRLGTARGGRGSIHFTPAPGRGGVREIVAQIQVDGVAAPDRTVGHYRADATVKTGKPQSLDGQAPRDRAADLLAPGRRRDRLRDRGQAARRRRAADQALRTPPRRPGCRDRQDSERHGRGLGAGGAASTGGGRCSDGSPRPRRRQRWRGRSASSASRRRKKKHR